ncbi:hypothetical protein UCDDA912_g03346 [Diaporthe ampelina]|uniref:Uncharacterized protein n=1 Tax=Diaporthe ampelina TaxID=1214573 RepID=A0A0G2FRR8_9PEZI|nr:hypothetical protein UCDDA912_g03346 [Diaporthe ampelina]
MRFSTVLVLISTAAAATLPHAARQNTNAQTVSAKTGLTDQEALDIFNTLDTGDANAPGSVNGNGQRNPIDGFSADETTDIVRQGLAEFREQNSIAESDDDEADDALPEGAEDQE